MKRLILAPHIDDELIGCSQLLLAPKAENEERHVVWFYELTPVRIAESMDLEHALGFTGDDADEFDWSTIETYDEVYVPSRKDSHIHHNQVTARYRKWATHYYSIDMVGASPLPLQDQVRKKGYLDDFYPSQQALWERDHKYWLFESILSTDYMASRTLVNNSWSLTVPEEYYSSVNRLVAQSTAHETSFGDKTFFNKVLSICITGKVTWVSLATYQILEA